MQEYLAANLERVGQVTVLGAVCLAIISVCLYVYLKSKSSIFEEGIVLRVNGETIDPESLSPSLREELKRQGRTGQITATS
jgi:hypothetical protein